MNILQNDGRNKLPGLPRLPHVMTADQVCSFFGVDAKVGLTEDQLAIQRSKFGPNVLTQKEGKSLWALLTEQFEDLLVRILLGAAFVSFLLAVFDSDSHTSGWSAFVEPGVILLILIANAAVSVWQEGNAEKSLEALKKLQPDVARCLRNGGWHVLPAADLVPADIVEVRVGDRIPADLRIIELKTTSLRAEQSQLTGEAVSVSKGSDPLEQSDSDCEIQKKENILFGTTMVSHGRAIGVVVATGMLSEIGKIQSAVEAAEEDEVQSPLQIKLDEFSQVLSKVILAICVTVWVINFKHFSDPSHGGFMRGCIYYFKIAVALAVAAIPEGLPAVITTCLALGTKKMAKRHAIVRKLTSVETLGCTSVICSDKTGTLTTNAMSCLNFAIFGAPAKLRLFKVRGHSFEPVGAITEELYSSEFPTGKPFPHITKEDHSIITMAKICAICNESNLHYDGEIIVRTGEPTEAALKILVEKLGTLDTALNAQALQKASRSSPELFCSYWTADFKQLAILEFSRDRKSMSVLTRQYNKNENTLFVKGAPENILERSEFFMLPDGSIQPLTPVQRKIIIHQVNSMAAKALRILALAVLYDCGRLADYDGPTHPSHKLLTDPSNFASFETNLVFVGLVGLLDPPRPEVRQSVRLCQLAGIKVIMITGDSKLTAEAIGREVGILGQPDTPEDSYNSMLKKYSFTGREFEMLSESNKLKVLSCQQGAIFSRTEPRHKQLIVKLLKDMGAVTAMTGDGVNDAPALKQADIGIAMGIAGTEVAKSASAMVLADDNFATIVSAVEEGRSIYNNMKAFIRYLISSNIGEVASIFLTAALGIPEGLAPVQLLWVNLVTDGLPATALGFNPPDVDVMQKVPRRREDVLISGWVFFRYFVIGAYVGIATVGILIWWFVFGMGSDDHTLISFNDLSHFGQCSSWRNFSAIPINGMSADNPCSYFTVGKAKASTLSLTVLVVIEMFNSLNALSEDHSLLEVPPTANPYLLLAVSGSIVLHCCILYIPGLASVFSVVPLSFAEWSHVLMWSFPVILIDEVLKAMARQKSPGSWFRYLLSSWNFRIKDALGRRRS